MIKSQIVERFANGEAIITEGIVSTKAYVILSGKVKVTKRVKAKTIVIGNLGEGDVFGEMGLIGKFNRTATVVAVGDVNLGVIDKRRFNSLLNSMPEDAQLVIRALIERLKITTDKLAHFASQFDNVKKALDSLSTKTID